jgi:enoyl-ACP reductase-like protein
VGRLGKPEEIARVAGFLAADDSAYITGQIWAVNGGLGGLQIIIVLSLLTWSDAIKRLKTAGFVAPRLVRALAIAMLSRWESAPAAEAIARIALTCGRGL